MAKAALEALAMTLAKEERAHGIRVNVVAPGLVDTDMGRRLVAATQGVENVRTLDATMPFGRVCQPEDVANVVRFLVSPDNSYLTGERIYLRWRWPPRRAPGRRVGLCLAPLVHPRPDFLPGAGGQAGNGTHRLRCQHFEIKAAQ